MDPTKPILNIEGSNNGCFYRDVWIKPVQKVTFQDKYSQLQHERDFYKSQYQRLYEAYKKQQSRLKECQNLKQYISQLQLKLSDLQHQNRGGGGDSHQIRILREKNDQLSETILNKNYELQDAYRRIQENGKKSQVGAPNVNRKVLASTEKLEQGIKEAVFSNFELLKNNSIGEIRNLIRNPGAHQHHQQQPLAYSLNPQTRQYQLAPSYVVSEEYIKNSTTVSPGFNPSNLPRY